MRSPLSRWRDKHMIPAGVGLCALLVLAFSSVSSDALLGSVSGTVADIGIEHQLPLALEMEVGILQNGMLIDITSRTEESILVSVPSTWVRKEVRNAPIHTVSSETPSLGFTRWTLPGGAGILFRSVEVPDHAVLHNPSGVEMKLNIAKVDVSTSAVDRDILLIQGDTVTLW